MVKAHSLFWRSLVVCQSCVAAIGVMCFSVRSFGCALFIFGGIKMSFSENLKAARKVKKLTQQQLADLLNIDRSAVAHYEKGTAMPQAKNIQMLCEVLNVTFDELFK